MEQNCDTSNPYRVIIRNPDAIENLPVSLQEELISHPIPHPVVDASGKHYMKFDDLWKKPMSKKPPQLPQTTNNTVDTSKKPGFYLNAKTARTSVKCNLCQKPRLVYSQCKPSG